MRLDNLVCVLDKNGKQLSRPTSETDGSSNIKTIWEGYGWNVREIPDGNSFDEIIPVYESLNYISKPTIIIAYTEKGKYLGEVENSPCGYHTISSCPIEIVNESIALQQKFLKRTDLDVIELVKNKVAHKVFPLEIKPAEAIETNIEIQNSFDKDNLVDTLVNYVRVLQPTIERQNARLYFLTADLIRKDQVDELGIRNPTTYLDVGIREQHMFGLAHGISQTDQNARILINAGDAFLYRSLDQLHACAQSRSPMVIVGDDGGLSGAKNGSTHQSSGQSGALITMPGIRFLEPADNQDLVNCLNLAFTEYNCPTYIRLHTLPVKNFDNLKRTVDNYIVFESKSLPELTMVCSGMVVSKCIEAAEILEERGVSSRVINVVNPKSLGKKFNNLIVNDKPCLCVYNGNPFVLTSAVSESILGSNRVNTPSVLNGHGFELGTSGALEDLLKYFKLDGPGIANIISCGLLG